jgi:nitrate reductase gamma subunit
MEEVDWAKKPRSSSLPAELVEMGAEIFFLKRVRQHNPYHLWPLSMALHWGIYLLLLWVGLLAAAVFIPTLTSLTAVVGVVAFVLGAGGAVALIVKRAANRNLALYTAPIDYLNLVFLTAIFGLGFVSWLADPLFSEHRAYVGSLLLLRPTPVPPVVASMFLLLQAFAIYMPCSKLIHYVMKHFTFRETLWDDAFNVKGSRKDKRIARQLSYEVGWAGPHVVPGKTWLEDVQATPAGDET